MDTNFVAEDQDVVAPVRATDQASLIELTVAELGDVAGGTTYVLY